MPCHCCGALQHEHDKIPKHKTSSTSHSKIRRANTNAGMAQFVDLGAGVSSSVPDYLFQVRLRDTQSWHDVPVFSRRDAEELTVINRATPQKEGLVSPRRWRPPSSA
jgi:hypothetical protein